MDTLDEAKKTASGASQSRTAGPPPDGQSGTLRWTFIGAQGLRPGWSALLFAAIYLAVRLAVGAALRPFVHMDKTHSIPAGIGLMTEGVGFLSVLAATWALAAIERRPILSYGYLDDRRALRFATGVLSGIGALSVLVALLWWRGLLVFDGRLQSGTTAWRYAAIWAAVFILVGFTEESLMRGYLQYTLTRGIGFWWAALVLSAAFGGLHTTNPGESPIGLLSVVGAGLLFALGLRLTGSLWWVVGLHAGWDWAQSYLYGVGDSGLSAQGHLLATHPVGAPLWSGGATGPEGSIFVVPVMLVMAGSMWLMWGRNRS
ncbi:MAG TPA: type II CAAX endopeptidase family protein [Acidisarcina sp.]